MSSTNKTTNYELTQFLATDVPSWLVDYNGDMSKIDTRMHANAVAAEAASTAATTAGNKADTAIANVATIAGVIEAPNTGILARMSSAENNINTIQSLIGNGEPTTTDKTIIGAINEIDAKIPASGYDAEDISYDNTSSGLTASNAQAAIDEVNTKADNNADSVADLEAYKIYKANRVNVKSYNSYQNAFTAPADGYLELFALANSVIGIHICFDDDPTDGPVLTCIGQSGQGAAGMGNSIFIKKGMKFFIYTQGTNDIAYWQSFEK